MKALSSLCVLHCSSLFPLASFSFFLVHLTCNVLERLLEVPFKAMGHFHHIVQLSVSVWSMRSVSVLPSAQHLALWRLPCRRRRRVWLQPLKKGKMHKKENRPSIKHHSKDQRGRQVMLWTEDELNNKLATHSSLIFSISTLPSGFSSSLTSCPPASPSSSI